MSSRLTRILPGCVWLLFGLGLLVESLRLDVAAQRNVSGAIGPQEYPLAIAGLIIAISLALIWQEAGGAARAEARPGVPEAEPAPRYGKVAAVVAVLVAYTLALAPVGYLLTTPLMLLAVMWISGERRWVLMLTSAAALTVLLWLAFRYLVYIVLPEGLLA